MPTNMEHIAETEKGLVVDLETWKQSRSGCKRVRLPVPIPLDIQRPLDRHMHGVFVQWRGADDQIPDRRIQKINEGLAKPWRRLSELFYLARVCGVAYQRVKDVVRALDWWVDLIYGRTSAARPDSEAVDLSRQITRALDDFPPKAA